MAPLTPVFQSFTQRVKVLLGGKALLEEECHCGVGVGFEIYHAQTMPSEAHLSLLPIDQDVELSAPSPAPCLPGCCHASHHDDNGLNL